MDRLDVSVIIPARNAAGLLPACLDSVSASRGVTFEVIVVNDASTDETERVARERGCRVLSLQTAIMAANCRNLGARHARGDVLVFFDADERMAPDTLRRFTEVLGAEPEVAAVVGSLTAETPAPGFFSQFKNLQHHYTHQTAAREGATLDSGRLAIRRQLFEALGGFEPAFAPASIEDIALGYRMRRQGLRIRFEPSIQVVHLKRYTFAGLVHSDVVHRAIPWTGLMLRERIFRNDLNTRSGNVISVVLAWLAVAALAAGVLVAGEWFWVAAGAVVLVGVANAPFLRVCAASQGVWFVLRAAAFLPVMYFYQGVGLLAGVYAYLRGRSVARERVGPHADYRVFEPGAPAGTTPTRHAAQPRAIE